MSPEYALELLCRGEDRADVFSRLREHLVKEEAYISQLGDFSSVYDQVADLVDRAEKEGNDTFCLLKAQDLLDELP